MVQHKKFIWLFNIYQEEISDKYWEFLYSKNDYFGFSALLLVAMYSAHTFCVDLGSSIYILAAWCLRFCQRSCEEDFFLQGCAEGWWKWRRSGCPSLAFSCMLRLPASSFLALQLHPVANALPAASSRLDIFKFFSFLKIIYLYRIEKNICFTSAKTSNFH